MINIIPNSVNTAAVVAEVPMGMGDAVGRRDGCGQLYRGVVACISRIDSVGGGYRDILIGCVFNFHRAKGAVQGYPIVARQLESIASRYIRSA